MMQCTLSGWVGLHKRLVVLNMSAEVFDELLDRRLRLGLTVEQLLTQMRDVGFLKPARGTTEGDIRKFIAYLDLQGAMNRPLPRILGKAGEQKMV